MLEFRLRQQSQVNIQPLRYLPLKFQFCGPRLALFPVSSWSLLSLIGVAAVCCLSVRPSLCVSGFYDAADHAAGQRPRQVLRLLHQNPRHDVSTGAASDQQQNGFDDDRGLFALVPGSSRSLTSPPCVFLSTFWATRTKRRFPWSWRTGQPGPFPEEPPLSWRSKTEKPHALASLGRFELLELSDSPWFSSFPSNSNWGSESDENQSYHNGNSDPRGFGRTTLVYRRIINNVQFIIKCPSYYRVASRSFIS